LRCGQLRNMKALLSALAALLLVALLSGYGSRPVPASERITGRRFYDADIVKIGGFARMCERETVADH